MPGDPSCSENDLERKHRQKKSVRFTDGRMSQIKRKVLFRLVVCAELGFFTNTGTPLTAGTWRLTCSQAPLAFLGALRNPEHHADALPPHAPAGAPGTAAAAATLFTVPTHARILGNPAPIRLQGRTDIGPAPPTTPSLPECARARAVGWPGNGALVVGGASWCGLHCCVPVRGDGRGRGRRPDPEGAGKP